MAAIKLERAKKQFGQSNSIFSKDGVIGLASSRENPQYITETKEHYSKNHMADVYGQMKLK